MLRDAGVQGRDVWRPFWTFTDQSTDISETRKGASKSDLLSRHCRSPSVLYLLFTNVVYLLSLSLSL